MRLTAIKQNFNLLIFNKLELVQIKVSMKNGRRYVSPINSNQKTIRFVILLNIKIYFFIKVGCRF